MQLEITHKLINDSRRLAKHLASGMVPVNQLRDFFQELNKSIDEQQGIKPRMRVAHKEDRKDKYKSKIA